MNTIPWLLSLATAVWFGLLARRADRNWLLWGIGGAFFALAVATLVMGLLHAVFIPMSHEAIARFHIQSLAAATVTVGVLGGIFTMGLYRSAPPPRDDPRRQNRPA
jgi:hypothetical protein